MPNMAIYAKYGISGAPFLVKWGDIAKCSSDALTLFQEDTPVKSYDQIKLLADFHIVKM